MKPTRRVGLLAVLLFASTLAEANERLIRVSGELQPRKQWDVKPEVGGRIKKVYVAVGDHVEAGDLLVDFANSLDTDESKVKVLAPTSGTISSVPVIAGQQVAPAAADGGTTGT